MTVDVFLALLLAVLAVALVVVNVGWWLRHRDDFRRLEEGSRRLQEESRQLVADSKRLAADWAELHRDRQRAAERRAHRAPPPDSASSVRHMRDPYHRG